MNKIFLFIIIIFSGLNLTNSVAFSQDNEIQCDNEWKYKSDGGYHGEPVLSTSCTMGSEDSPSISIVPICFSDRQEFQVYFMLTNFPDVSNTVGGYAKLDFQFISSEKFSFSDYATYAAAIPSYDISRNFSHLNHPFIDNFLNGRELKIRLGSHTNVKRIKFNLTETRKSFFEYADAHCPFIKEL